MKRLSIFALTVVLLLGCYFVINPPSTDSVASTPVGREAVATSSQPTSYGSPAVDLSQDSVRELGHIHSGHCAGGCALTGRVASIAPEQDFISRDVLNIGTVKSGFDGAKFQSLFGSELGSKVAVKVNGVQLSGVVNLSHENQGSFDLLGVELSQPADSVMSLVRSVDGSFRGQIRDRIGKVAYQLVSNHSGDEVKLTRVDITDLMCGTSPETGLPGTHALTAPEGFGGQASDQLGDIEAVASPEVLQLQSLPGAPKVIYLDFDGEVVRNTTWNIESNGGQPINALDAGIFFNDTSINDIWSGIAEDYLPFNVNVTTSRAVYDAASPTNRMMVIYTNTPSIVGPGALGVAYLNSFGDESAKVCWVFVDTLTDIIGLATIGSHELGHTLRMEHDGINTPDGPLEYYGGHGRGDLSYTPIMGNGIDKAVSLWDPGFYPGATNVVQDDLAIIGNILGRRPNSGGVAQMLPIAIDGSVDFEGQILFGSQTDSPSSDYSFNTSGGLVSFTAQLLKPDAPVPAEREAFISNLDLSLSILTLEGDVLATANNINIRETQLETSLPPGDFILRVSSSTFAGVAGDDADFGYPTYGQFGDFHLTGNASPGEGFWAAPASLNFVVVEGAQIDPISMRVGAVDDSDYNYNIEVQGPSANLISVTPSSGTVNESIDDIVVMIDTDQLTIGSYSASLVITTDNPTTPGPLSVPITFNVIPPTNFDGISIPEFGPAEPYPSVISIPQGRGATRSLEVTITGLTHLKPGELQLLLVTPTGKSFMLLDEGSGRDPVAGMTMTFTIDGEALKPQGFLFDGSFMPMGPNPKSFPLPAPAPGGNHFLDLRAVNGDPAAGDYLLYVNDTKEGYGGFIESWALNLRAIEGSDLQDGSVNQVREGFYSINFTSVPGVTYAVEASTDLAVWQEQSRVTAQEVDTTVFFPHLSGDSTYFRVRRVN